MRHGAAGIEFASLANGPGPSSGLLDQVMVEAYDALSRRSRSWRPYRSPNHAC